MEEKPELEIKIAAAETPTLSSQVTMVSVSDKPPKLTRQQELNIAKLSYLLYNKNEVYSPDAIRQLWPTDPALHWKAGDRPSLTAIQRHQTTPIYRDDMGELGLVPDPETGGLTAEQIVVIDHLTSMSSTKSFQTRIKELGIKPHIFRAWMRQKPFNDAIKAFAGNALKDSISMAEVQLGAQAAAGDLKAIKYMFEVTGRHDPVRQQAVDTQALIGVIIDSVQEVFGKHPEQIKEFIELVNIRAQSVKGVIGN